MYELRIGNETIYKPGVIDLVMASSPQVTFELNTQGMLDLQMQSSHPFYSKITQHKTVIDLYDSNEWLAAFRVINVDVDFYNIKTVECNGVLDFLNDTIVRPFQFTGSITNLLKKLLDNHNSQVDEFKKIYLGQVTVVDTNNYVNRSSGNYMNTLECINDRLIKSHGGYLRIRKVNGKYYLDYITDYGVVSKQTIRFGENLLDLNNYIQGDTLATAIIPLGAELEENGINDVKKRVTIESVNNGKDYIYSTEGVKQFGYVWQTVTWDDVTQPSNLLTKAKQYLSENANMDISIEIKAVDLAYIDINASMIKLGDWIPVESFPHNLQRNFLVSKLEIDIENPENSIINLGSVIGTFTSNTTSNNKDVQSTIRDEVENVYVWYNDAIQKATDLINGGTGGYVYTATNAAGQPNEIYIMDKPQVDQAKNLIRFNVNGIGFSNNGINGPYRNAWTIDGRFNADFITTGTLRAINLIGNNIEGANIKGSVIEGGKIQSNTSGYKALEIINGMIRFFDWKTNHRWIGDMTPTTYANGEAAISIVHAKNSEILIGYFDSDSADTTKVAGRYIKFDKYGSSIPIVFSQKTSISDLKSKNISFNNATNMIFESTNNASMCMRAATDIQLQSQNGKTTVFGNFLVTGSKNRIVETENYGARALNAVESPEALFEDSGHNQTNGKGICQVDIDDVFKECVNTKENYYIQITKYGKGDVFVYKKHKDFFVVKGTPNLAFDWCIKAKQKGYESVRAWKQTQPKMKGVNNG